MNINKDTKLYVSFSKQAGNKGCEFFNAAFQKYGINAIYKSFSVNKIEEAFEAAKILKMSGFAVAMPFKIKMWELMKNPPVCWGVINTVVGREGAYDKDWYGYNTDYEGVKQILEKKKNNYDHLFIIGNGGLSKSVKAAWSKNFTVITKEQVNILKYMSGALIYNCSPGDYSYLSEKNNFIDCRVGTSDGDELHLIQAKAQFKLYTGIDYGS